MPFGKGRRKLALYLGFILAGLGTIWFSCPLWFPWVLRPLASHAGARFSVYERRGYSRFVVRDFVLTQPSFRVQAQSVEALVPTVWLWKLAAGPGNLEPFLRVNDWDCKLLPTSGTKSSPYSDVQDAAAVFQYLKRWVPKAVLSKGALHSGDVAFAIPAATWSEGVLQVQAILPPSASGTTIMARLTQALPFNLRVEAPSAGVESTFVLTTNNAALEIQNSTIWRSNRLDLQASFERADSLPRTAALQARELKIPGNLVNLPEYSEVTGSLSAQWQSNQFAIDLNAAARAAAAQSNLPPIKIDFHAHGNTNSATIHTLAVHLPFLDAHLVNEVSLSLSSPYFSGPATLNLEADLSRQRWIPLTGKLTGHADISPEQRSTPVAQLHLSGSDIGNASIKASSFEMSASLKWPLLKVMGLDLHFADGSSAKLSGNLDMEKQEAADGHFQFAGLLANHWLPTEYSYKALSVSGTLDGPLRKLSHAGSLVANGITTPMLQPLSLNLQWSGEATALQRFEIRLGDTNSTLVAAGAASMTPEEGELRLSKLAMYTNQSPALELAEPLSIRVAAPRPGIGWRLSGGPLHWSGAGGELSAQAAIEWPNKGTLHLSLRQFPLQLFAPLTKAELPRVDVRVLEASANWSNGPVMFNVDGAGTGLAQASRSSTQKPDQPVTHNLRSATTQVLETPLNFELKLTGDDRGLVLSNFLVNTSTSSVAVAQGFLPLTLRPAAGTNYLTIASDQPLFLKASVRPEAFFWENLAELSGFRLQDPNLDVNLAGTWSAPQGKIVFQAPSIRLTKTNSIQLSLEDLHLALTLDRDKARLTEGQLLVQGQQVSLTGELPLGRNAWTALRQKQLPAWDTATGRLRISNAELAALEPLFPQILAPQGELNVDLQLLPGAKFDGTMMLRRARTRPVGNSGPFRDINVTLRFRERSLLLEKASARLGGADVNLSGKVDLHGTNWLAGGLPPFNLALRGTNVPLARAPEFIIRSDLDLVVAKTNDAPPVISGTAQLRDSFYLSDLSALVPGKVATPSARPPYFSIDDPTLANWRLAVKVEGVRWLKVRSSMFNGEVSANLHLEGTLKDPLALGVIKIDSGLARFPFANLELQQGLITLSSENPYHPQILVRSASKQFGYDIRAEVSGSVDSPVIQFTSNPALSSEQILLMITAGQLPSGSFTLTPQQRAQTVALFLGRDIWTKLGLADPSQERFTISSGQEITDQGRPTYNVEYKVSPRWSVVGEYDRFGDFNAGLKWRIYSK